MRFMAMANAAEVTIVLRVFRGRDPRWRCPGWWARIANGSCAPRTDGDWSRGM